MAVDLSDDDSGAAHRFEPAMGSIVLRVGAPPRASPPRSRSLSPGEYLNSLLSPPEEYLNDARSPAASEWGAWETGRGAAAGDERLARPGSFGGGGGLGDDRRGPGMAGRTAGTMVGRVDALGAAGRFVDASRDATSDDESAATVSTVNRFPPEVCARAAGCASTALSLLSRRVSAAPRLVARVLSRGPFS